MSLARNTKLAARGGPKRRAAPAGGALNRGRGCHYSTVLALALTALPALADATAFTTPSGLDVHLQEFVDESAQVPALLRARFVAPAMTADHPGSETVLSDMEHLCNAIAIPHVTDNAIEASQIVISVSAEPLELGVFDPEIPQYFEAYTIQDGTCIWEWY